MEQGKSRGTPNVLLSQPGVPVVSPTLGLGLLAEVEMPQWGPEPPASGSARSLSTLRPHPTGGSSPHLGSPRCELARHRLPSGQGARTSLQKDRRGRALQRLLRQEPGRATGLSPPTCSLGAGQLGRTWESEEAPRRGGPLHQPLFPEQAPAQGRRGPPEREGAPVAGPIQSP